MVPLRIEEQLWISSMWAKVFTMIKPLMISTDTSELNMAYEMIP